jgi:hypothetical protein
MIRFTDKMVKTPEFSPEFSLTESGLEDNISEIIACDVITGRRRREAEPSSIRAMDGGRTLQTLEVRGLSSPLISPRQSSTGVLSKLGRILVEKSWFYWSFGLLNQASPQRRRGR